MVGDVGVDVAVDDHHFAAVEPAADHRGCLLPVAGVEQGDEIGVDLIQSAELAAQKTGDELAVQGGVEPRKVEVFDVLAVAFFEQTAHEFHLGGFACAVEAFDNDEHGRMSVNSYVYLQIISLCRLEPYLS